MWTNSANKFFDGLASGTPIALNYGGWQAEILQNEGCGIVLPVLAPDKAAVMISEFLYNDHRLKIAAVQARAVAEKYFDRDKHAIEFESVLNRAVSEQR